MIIEEMKKVFKYLFISSIIKNKHELIDKLIKNEVYIFKMYLCCIFCNNFL